MIPKHELILVAVLDWFHANWPLLAFIAVLGALLFLGGGFE